MLWTVAACVASFACGAFVMYVGMVIWSLIHEPEVDEEHNKIVRQIYRQRSAGL